MRETGRLNGRETKEFEHERRERGMGIEPNGAIAPPNKQNLKERLINLDTHLFSGTGESCVNLAGTLPLLKCVGHFARHEEERFSLSSHARPPRNDHP
jgi:hypothetical protein